MKKVIVTGATGFVGSWVTKELLAHGIEVIAVVRENSHNLEKLQGQNVKIVFCNLSNMSSLPQLIEDRDIDTVYHFGWQGVSDEDIRNADIQMENVKATLDLIKVMPDLGSRTFIGAGSLHEIESFYDMKEDKVIKNLGYMYKAAKISAHWMGKALAGSMGIRFFWPIISNTFGAGENSGRLINTIVRKVLKGEVPALSAGKQNYDFVYISDVARALYLIGEKGIDGTNYFIGSGEAKPLREYLEIVGSMANKTNNSNIALGFGEIKSNVVYLPGEVFDISTLVRDTGYAPQISFEEGVEQTVNWIKDNL